jgi:hypothetical protein
MESWISGGLGTQHLTFERRGTHPLPTILDVPPPDWQIPFQALAEECGLLPDIAAAFERVREFFERALAGPREH